jgi:hypothetical protein
MKDAKFTLVASVIIGVLLLFGWIALSYLEASAFTHVTGKTVSTWDAMWIELRVQEGAQ